MSATTRSASTGAEPLLALHGVSKRFGAVQALAGVDFDVRAGEVVGLVGDNGAGKSTLVKVMSGIYSADEGEYRFEGAVRRVSGPSDATALGVATVYQDLALCDNLDVVANLFVGREELSGGLGSALRALDEASMEKQAAELLQTLTVRLPSVRQEVGTLSGGQRQSVAIARSLIGEAKVVLLDEPTAALGVAQTEQVLQLIRRLREQGLGVVVISHNLANVFDVVDRIFVLRLGRKAGMYEVGDTTQEEIVGAITGAEFGRGANGGGGASGDPARIADSDRGSSASGGGATEATR
jgi:D-xylose transport system ATP-binding protein